MTIKKVEYNGNMKVPVKLWTDDVESSAAAQLRNCAQLPFIYKHIAVMPDVHYGIGCTIGAVIPTKGAIIPATVGVDLGCGMMAVKTTLKAEDLPDNLYSVREAIEKVVPHGRSHDGGQNDCGAWKSFPLAVQLGWNDLKDSRYEYIKGKYPKIFEKVNDVNHLGTLGTGNHFIEVCLDEENCVWCLLHSGSRGIGNRIGSFFIKRAKEEALKWYINLPDKDLAYFPEGSKYFDDYIKAVSWAQDFALSNREIMMAHSLHALYKALKINVDFPPREEVINCHHNYVDIENHYGKNVYVTRKGAIRARKNDLGIIPGSMGDKSFIVRGKGNPESFHSCSHGAGRKMGRMEAKRRFTTDDLIKQTEGVECRKDSDVLDEIPSAYKSIEDVMKNQEDLVDIVHVLKQVINIKG